MKEFVKIAGWCNGNTSGFGPEDCRFESYPRSLKIMANFPSLKEKFQNKELHRVTSTAIIYKNKKYLLVQRSFEKKAFPGKWTVPGGGLEVSDYINLPKTTSQHWYFAVENSLRREIKEEVNLEVGKINYLCSITFIRPDGIPVLILSYYAPYKSGKVKLNKENINYAWVTFEEAKKYDLVEGLIDEIKMVDKILRKK